MLGTVGVSFAPVGQVGLTVGSGDTLGKMIQLILLNRKLGAAPTNEGLLNEVADLLRESELFMNVDLPPNFSSDRGRIFYDAIESMVTEWMVIMECGLVDLEQEAEQNAQIKAMTQAQARAAAGFPPQGGSRAQMGQEQHRILRPS